MQASGIFRNTGAKKVSAHGRAGSAQSNNGPRETCERRSEGGFTLVELMTVVLVISILVAIAVPTYIGMRNRAQDSQAKSDLRNAVTAAQGYFTDNEGYALMDAAALTLIEAQVIFDDGDPPAATDRVYVSGVSDDDFTLKTLSDSGTTFEAAVVDKGPINYNF